MAQPTLSHAIARLEAEAGERLLERPRKVRPKLTATPAGKRLELRARRAVGEVQALGDDLSTLRGVVCGHVRVGSMLTLNSALVPRPLARFALDHPEVQVRLHTLAAEEIPAALAEGRIDVGLIAGAPSQVLGDLEARRLCSEELVAIVRHDDPLATDGSFPLKQLAGRGFVMVLPATFTNGIVVEHQRNRRRGLPQGGLRAQGALAARVR